MEREILSLFELQSLLKAGVEMVFPSSVWVRAEISAMKARPGSHCYLELSESGPSGLKAKVQAAIWSSKYRVLAPRFEAVAGTPLREGISIMARVQVSYSQLYGLTLSIIDIDPEHTLGEKELLRQQTIDWLRAGGYFDMQKMLSLPPVVRRMCVISAEDAAGYRDFRNHLASNQYGFAYETVLAAAQMQGADCPSSIIEALDSLEEHLESDDYDVVMILRGGGSKLDLSWYDDRELCARIATFPRPVITAIGHDQDFHIADMVAYLYLKTPTALADEIISWTAARDAELVDYANRLRLAFTSKISSMQNRLSLLEAKIRAADPRNILSRGYVLALDGRGVVAKSAAALAEGEKMRVMFSDGSITCTIDKVEMTQKTRENVATLK